MSIHFLKVFITVKRTLQCDDDNLINNNIYCMILDCCPNSSENLVKGCLGEVQDMCSIDCFYLCPNIPKLHCTTTSTTQRLSLHQTFHRLQLSCSQAIQYLVSSVCQCETRNTQVWTTCAMICNYVYYYSCVGQCLAKFDSIENIGTENVQYQDTFVNSMLIRYSLLLLYQPLT